MVSVERVTASIDICYTYPAVDKQGFLIERSNNNSWLCCCRKRDNSSVILAKYSCYNFANEVIGTINVSCYRLMLSCNNINKVRAVLVCRVVEVMFDEQSDCLFSFTFCF